MSERYCGKARVFRSVTPVALPVVKRVTVRNACVGPRGGHPTAQLEIEFVTPVSGPLMLGRTSHTGGGLFHAVT